VTRRRLAVVALVLAGALVVGGIAVAGAFKATSTHQFCSSCHIMQPYVQGWTASRHSKVECVQCHFPPTFKDALWVKFQASTQLVKWATDTYSSKPFADVRDASCLRSGCHATSALDTRAPLAFKRVTGFAHGVHLDPGKTGVALRCTSCHAQTVVDRHFEVTESTCFTCHFKGSRGNRELKPLGGCPACHGAPVRDLRVGSGVFNHRELVQRGVPCQSCHINVVEGAGDAPADRCIGCHNEREKLALASSVPAVHRAHVTERSIECTRCHTSIKHRLPPLPGATALAPTSR
jgi:nitrate/TMAO reductase-like tetraheme cytochrome c subunit